METISINELHSCFRKSYYCSEFKNPEKNTIKIPPEYILNKILIQNKNDFFEVLRICKFWNVLKLPKEVFEYVCSNQDLDLRGKIYNYDFELLTFQALLRNGYKDDALLMIDSFVHK